MQPNYSGAEFLPVSLSSQRERKFREIGHFSSRSRAVTAETCTKKRAARAELLVCLFNLLLF